MSYASGVAAPIELIRPCQVCMSATTLRCSRCKNAFYCSAEHISSDWPQHRWNCNPAGSVPRTPSPPFPPSSSVTHNYGDLQSIVQAVWFPPNEEVWTNVNIVCNIIKGDKPTSIPILDRFLHPSDTASVTLSTGLNGLSLRCPFQVWYSPSTLERGFPANRSIGKITHGLARCAWPGTVVVLKFAGKAMKEHIAIDTANDLPALVDFFIDHRRWPTSSSH